MARRISRPERGGGIMGATALATALSAVFFGAEAPAAAHVAIPAAELAAEVKAYRIPAGSVTAALNRLADANGAQLVYKSRLTRDLATSGVSGEFTLEGALDHLLAGTGLRYRLARSGRSVAIVLAQNDTIVDDSGATALPPIDIGAERREPTSRDSKGLSTPLHASEIGEEKLYTARPTASDTAQLLNEAPGVGLYEAGGVSRLPSLRGLADDRIKILLGGGEVTSACANHMNPPLSYIDPNNVGKIEVLSGVTPVSKGGDSIAGTIIVEPKPPAFAGQSAPAPQGLSPIKSDKLILSGVVSAFWRSTNNGISVSGTANAATDHFSLLYNGGYTRASDYHAGGNGPKVLSTGFIAENHSATLAYQNDGHLFTLQGGYQNIPYQGFVNQRMDMTANRAFSVNGGYKGAFEWGKLEANAYWRHVSHEMGFLYDKQPANMPMNASGTDYGYSIKAEIPLTPADLLRVGNEFHGNHLNDWWPPIIGSMMMGPGAYWNINGGQRDRIGTYAEWEKRWTPQWSTLLGARNDVVWMNTGLAQAYDPRDPIPMGMGMMMMGMANPDAGAAARFNARDHRRTDVNFDMTASVRYQPDDVGTYELGYSRKTRSPNLYERYAFGVGGMASSMVGWFGDANGYVGNLDLKPEVAHTVSFTAAWRDPADEWEVKATPYFSYVENYIDADPIGGFTDKNGRRFPILQFRNHKAQLYGFDLSGRAKLYETPEIGRFALSGVLGYVYGENLDRGDGLYHIMPFNARFALEHRLGGWSSAVEVQVVDSKTHVSAARNEWQTPSYALVNLRSGYDFGTVRIDAGIANLGDVRYYSPLGGFNYAEYKRSSIAGPVPGPGRTFYAGVTVRF
jgi:iron complex outermembrane receptor protein